MLQDEHGQNYFDTQLLDHIKDGKTEKAIEILKNTPNSSQLVDSKGRKLMHYIAQSRNRHIVEYLMNLNTEIDPQDYEGKTPLMLVTNSQMLDVLLRFQADMHICDKNGKCALQLFLESEFGLTFLFALRLEYFFDFEKISKKLIEFKCSIYTAVALEDSRIIKLLLEHKCPWVPSESSLCKGDVIVKSVRLLDFDTVKVLLDYNIDIDAEDSNGKTALSSCTALLTGYHGYVSSPFYDLKEVEMFQWILNHGANPSKITKAGDGQMQMGPFLQWSHKNVTRILLKVVDFKSRDKRGCTALHYMAASYCPDIFSNLVGRKYDVNVRDNDGSTPLHHVNVRNLNSIISLTSMGANVHAKNKAGMTALIHMWHNCENHLILSRITLEEIKQSFEYLLYLGNDIQVMNRNKKLSIFSNFSLSDETPLYHKYWMPSVLAHLAVVEAQGKPISKHIKRQISNCVPMKMSFDICKKQLKLMKKNKIFKSISLHQLLIENDWKLEHYVRNKQLLLNLHRIRINNKYPPYYRYSLRNRLVRAFKIVEMRKIVANTISKEIGFCQVIADNIVSYIGQTDLEKMI